MIIGQSAFMNASEPWTCSEAGENSTCGPIRRTDLPRGIRLLDTIRHLRFIIVNRATEINQGARQREPLGHQSRRSTKAVATATRLSLKKMIRTILDCDRESLVAFIDGESPDLVPEEDGCRLVRNSWPQSCGADVSGQSHSWIR